MPRGRTGLAVAVLTVALAAACLGSLVVGAEPVGPAAVLDVVRGRGAPEHVILFAEFRLPRTLVAVAVGAALGVAGALIQAFTRNPLADPGILGISAGAAFAVTLAVSVIGLVDISTLLWPALAGALLTTLAVLLLAGTGRGPATPLRMTLAGVAIAAVLSGVAGGIRITDPSTFDRIRSWAAGSVAGRSLDDLLAVLPCLLIGLVVALLLTRSLNALALGDDTARSLGVNLPVVRVVTVLTITLLAGSATAIAGPILFLGLMVPHACRLLVGNDHVRIVALSLLAAPLLLVVADVLARVILPMREVPVGVITAFLGGPVLIALVRQRRTGAM